MDSKLDFKALIEAGSNAEVIEAIKDADVYKILFPHGENLLHWACAYNNVEIAEYLLGTKKLHVNMANFRFAVPLYYAAMKGSTEVIELMINKYHANPRERSGFSGMFPVDIAESEELKKLLAIPDFKDYHRRYRYRVYKHWLSNLNDFIVPYPHDFGTTFIPEAKEIFKEQGAKVLGEKCQELWEEYLAAKELKGQCLHCQKVTENECRKCKKAWYCSSECQKATAMYHNFDCPEITLP